MLISFVVTAKLICVFVFAYAKNRFSHNEAHICMFNVSCFDIGEGDVSYRFTHDVKAGMSLRWAHMGFFVLLMHSCSISMNRAACKLHSAIPSLPKSDIPCL